VDGRKVSVSVFVESIIAFVPMLKGCSIFLCLLYFQQLEIAKRKAKAAAQQFATDKNGPPTSLELDLGKLAGRFALPPHCSCLALVCLYMVFQSSSILLSCTRRFQ
jgi:hypothetical protein